MNEGESVERGTHQELLNKKVMYYNLWEMQQGNFTIRNVEYKEDKEEIIYENEISYI